MRSLVYGLSAARCAASRSLGQRRISAAAFLARSAEAAKVKVNYKIRLLSVALAVGLVTPTTPSGASESEVKSLSNIPAFCVVVEDLRPELLLSSSGITKAQLATDVELRCRSFGLNVQPNTDPRLPYLYVRLNTTLVGENALAYSLNVYFEQKVRCSQNDVVTVASTWETGMSGFAGGNRIADIKDDVLLFTDQFINKYLSQNPKQVPKTVPDP
jgi:hypothetical protein